MVAAALLTTTLKADTMSDALMRRPTGVISTFQQQQTIISQSVDFCFLRRSSFIMYRQRWIDWQTNRDVDKETEGERGREMVQRAETRMWSVGQGRECHP